jgi:hypothetical protein
VSGAVSKAKDLRVGARGIIYCSDTQTFTTPFLVASKPEPDKEIDNVWPETWTLPFRIMPLGTPRRQLQKDRLSSVLPSLQGSDRHWNHVLLIQPTTVFVPSQVGDEDWEVFLLNLATEGGRAVDTGPTGSGTGHEAT